jgi:hypothetical protein
LLRKPVDDKLAPANGFQQESILIIKRSQGPASFAVPDHRAFQRTQKFFQAGGRMVKISERVLFQALAGASRNWGDDLKGRRNAMLRDLQTDP